MIKTFKIQIGFFLSPEYHTFYVEDSKVNYGKPQSNKIINNVNKNKFKSTRRSRNSTF